MRRREFITLIASAATVRPLAARAQQSALPVLGFLNSTSAHDSGSLVAAFRTGLSETNYVEGQNLAIEFRWAEGQYARLPMLAAELVRRQVAVIASTGGIGSAQAAKAATASIPIVFTSGFDPVAMGLVASLNKPGGNVTGVSFFAAQLSAKRLDILRDLVPSGEIAMLVNPSYPNFARELKDAESAVSALGQHIRVLNASSDREFDVVSTMLAGERPGALLVSGDPFFFARRDQLVALAARYAIPAMYNEREYVSAGGLISYGASISDGYRQAGTYVGKILQGAKPGDLPIMQATKFELAINLKTAKGLGLAIPDRLLAIADEVIE
jgi:putative tryptophan/tyrosine transport system substrate-binding protein